MMSDLVNSGGGNGGTPPEGAAAGGAAPTAIIMTGTLSSSSSTSTTTTEQSQPPPSVVFRTEKSEMSGGGGGDGRSPLVNVVGDQVDGNNMPPPSQVTSNGPMSLNAPSNTAASVKKTSFQITSVTVDSSASNDGGDDSADDLDESHTEDSSTGKYILKKSGLNIKWSYNLILVCGIRYVEKHK